MALTADDLIASWRAGLTHERRASAHTLRAYGNDLNRFLAFMRTHHGERVTLGVLQKISTADIRAFLTARRGEGLSAGGIQRALSALRSIYR